MVYGKLNVWIKNERCQVIRRAGHLHIYDCHGVQVIPTLWFTDGNVEVSVPPGCYIITAGVVSGNIYTDKTLVMVRCGEEICVNLILNSFREQELEPNLVKAQLYAYGCAARIISPLIVNAVENKISPDELNPALSVLLKAANIDKEFMIESINSEIELLKENINQFNNDEVEIVNKYIKQLQSVNLEKL